MESAVSYQIYNRIKQVEITFPIIKECKPKKLYIVADGPKNEKDSKDCNICRKTVESSINWDCEVIKIYSNINLGLAKRTVSALDEIFNYEDRIIFLEDDNLIDKSFFMFCNNLLEKYSFDNRIFHIGGCNYFEKAIPKSFNYDYIFTARVSGWGFATWKRAWSKMDLTMKGWEQENKSEFLNKWCIDKKHKQGMMKVFDQHCMNEDPWAWSYAWIYACWSNSALSIIPTKNLISNIGFNKSATNTKLYTDEIVHIPERRNSLKRINHPDKIIRDINFEKNSLRIERNSLWQKIINKLLK